MSKDIQQISEGQANEMIEHLDYLTVTYRDRAELMKAWKKAGYIKKSKLEIARSYFNVIYREEQKNYPFNQLKELYEQAIEEIQNKELIDET